MFYKNFINHCKKLPHLLKLGDDFRSETEDGKVVSAQLGILVVKNRENFHHYVDI